MGVAVSKKESSMSEHFDVVILGSGQGGKLLAWHLGRSGKKVAVVERRWVGGSCPAVACLPSKNELWGARVAHLVRDAGHFGTLADGVRTDMPKVRQRKQDMIDREIAFHLKVYRKRAPSSSWAAVALSDPGPSRLP
jgi:pyruvate/2-oxoglutarate dehydrogenase complex dihydrolipoamide dehydrogenase (E3) component